jgi:hypothetical protein
MMEDRGKNIITGGEILILIYLSTAIGFTPGGSGTVHTINT